VKKTRQRIENKEQEWAEIDTSISSQELVLEVSVGSQIPTYHMIPTHPNTLYLNTTAVVSWQGNRSGGGSHSFGLSLNNGSLPGAHSSGVGIDVWIGAMCSVLNVDSENHFFFHAIPQGTERSQFKYL
jgi:hypothetical protein